MLTVQRVDNVSLSGLKFTREGFLEAPARVAKVGILTYFDQAGKPFKELVPAETLFNKESCDGLPGIPITSKHPGKMVSSDTAAQVMRGFTLGPHSQEKDDEDELLGCKVKIVDKGLIDQVQSGMQELSLGYDAVLDMIPGVWKGEHYDAIQTKRTYNHLAVVPVARAGRKARLRLDAAQNQIDEEDSMLVKIKIDGVEMEVEKAVADRLTKVEGGLKDAIELAELEKKRADTAEGTATVLQKKIDEGASETATKEAAKKLDAQVKARVTLIEQAKSVLPKEGHAKLDELDEQGIMVAVLTNQDKEFKSDGLSVDYIKGAFAAAMKAFKPAKTDSASALGSLIVHGDAAGAAGGEATVQTLDAALDERRQSIKDRWKTPIMAGKA